jgi:hypothetical protein
MKKSANITMIAGKLEFLLAIFVCVIDCCLIRFWVNFNKNNKFFGFVSISATKDGSKTK